MVFNVAAIALHYPRLSLDGIYAFFERRDCLQLISTEHPECIKPRCSSSTPMIRPARHVPSPGNPRAQYPAYRLGGAFCAPYENNSPLWRIPTLHPTLRYGIVRGSPASSPRSHQRSNTPCARKAPSPPRVVRYREPYTPHCKRAEHPRFTLPTAEVLSLSRPSPSNSLS